jgi:hypothetical protein
MILRSLDFETDHDLVSVSWIDRGVSTASPWSMPSYQPFLGDWQGERHGLETPLPLAKLLHHCYTMPFPAKPGSGILMEGGEQPFSVEAVHGKSTQG